MLLLNKLFNIPNIFTFLVHLMHPRNGRIGLYVFWTFCSWHAFKLPKADYFVFWNVKFLIVGYKLRVLFLKVTHLLYLWIQLIIVMHEVYMISALYCFDSWSLWKFTISFVYENKLIFVMHQVAGVIIKSCVDSRSF